METKLCRICGKLGENYVHIFKTEGLKNKIETCLPIIVSPHCLLPDTICSECLENVDNFYSFIKNCLQNIIVLEAQYDITESCLKTKRKHDKSSLADFNAIKFDKNIQTDDESLTSQKCKNSFNLELVSYDIESDTNSDHEDSALEGKVVIAPKRNAIVQRNVASHIPLTTNYFDDAENDLISEIVQRKCLKRKSETILPYRSKIFKIDSSNRRKSKQPKKLESRADNIFNELSAAAAVSAQTNQGAINSFIDSVNLDEYTEEDKLAALQQVEKEINNSIPQICLLCDSHFPIPSALAAHVYESHGIDMAQVMSQTTEPQQTEKKKKIPNLVKITDLKPKPDSDDNKQYGESFSPEEPPTLQPFFVCPMCPATLASRIDLFTHLRVKHPEQAALMCGLCMHVSSSYVNLNTHLESCRTLHNITSKYVCKLCGYSDDNQKTVENHVVVHDFVLTFCKKQAKMFDPSDYVEVNNNSDGVAKLLSCSECEMTGFTTFKEFSTHRRSQHQIFHCDLCNKFYGRNSHLWKHVNRLHKGHPSITCQLCYKTSASKYHLAQHFNKIHSTKPYKQKSSDPEDDFLNQKFRAFDFQSVKQSFMRQEMLEKGKKLASPSDDEGQTDDENFDDTNSKDDEDEDMGDNLGNSMMDGDMTKGSSSKAPPKEIDTSSNLYTNIITNYTPPVNDGEFKCPKCFKGFHKKTLLKKHKTNCRPRLQKDLLTRCKTCSRIFKDRQSLTKHLINYHSEYTCEICGQKVQSKCEIVSHIRFSHPDCHLVCHCGNILRNQADLAEHTRDHKNSFVCQFCADMLPTKIKLKMHILSLHRKILSLSCGICLKLFETQYILRDHVRLVHKDNLSPLTSCTVCGKNYGSKWKTYDHLNKSHGRIFKACKACLEVFDTEEDMQSHYNTMHGNGSQSLKKEGSNGQNSTDIKKDAYESDYDQLNDDNSDKNSCSELSNDAETFPCQEPKIEPVEDVSMNDYEVTSQESKISLLEKRLLGKKLPDAAKPKNSIVPKPTIPNNELKIPKIEKKKTEIFRKSDFDSESSDLNCTQNSSKRTVYVNSNDPSICEICLKMWPAKKHLWQHYIRCHKSVAATVCGICLKTNPDYETLQLHLRETHPTLLHGQGFGSNFICRICGRYHNASSKLKLHMAIHENFDWSILENGRPIGAGGMQDQKSNGCIEDDRVLQSHPRSNAYITNEDINYESMIEQVECSSDSDIEDSDNENGNGDINDGSSSESDVESVTSENSLEAPVLNNMVKDTPSVNAQIVQKQEPKVKEEVVVKAEFSSSDSDDSSNSSGSYSDLEGYDVKQEDSSSEDGYADKKDPANSNSNTNDSSTNIFDRKPGELDSAIRSISYDQIVDVDNDADGDYCEIQSQNLNQNEIESAVDSIL